MTTNETVTQPPRRAYRVRLPGHVGRYAYVDIIAESEADAIAQTKDAEFLATILECAKPEGLA